MKVLLASTNPGKIREITEILHNVPAEVVTLRDYPHIAEPEETGATFAENARLKALYYESRTGVPSVADDSGLEIDALGGVPGIQSARWQGSDYQVKFRKIYELLRARRLAGSGARFVAAVAFAMDGRIVFETEGIVEGEIASEPRGTHGFGYDPVFFYPPYGCTLAEVDGAKKAAVSHRGAAFRNFRDYLLTHLRP
ncbi:MAG: RdgB/HAM1 family non-canonical purine NTP pyrophosphatase [Vicinamibacterales bacterium]